jgi:hypothetical protein
VNFDVFCLSLIFPLIRNDQPPPPTASEPANSLGVRMACTTKKGMLPNTVADKILSVPNVLTANPHSRISPKILGDFIISQSRNYFPSANERVPAKFRDKENKKYMCMDTAS